MSQTKSEGKMATKDYNKQYYLENRVKIAARRRERYKEDSTFRASQIKRSSDRRRKLRLKKLASQRTSVPVKKLTSGAKMMHLPSGKKALMFPISHMARAVGRSILTVRVWLRKGIIPEPFRDPQQNRRWTHDQVQLIIDLFEIHTNPKKPKETLAPFRVAVTREWARLDGGFAKVFGQWVKFDSNRRGVPKNGEGSKIKAGGKASGRFSWQRPAGRKR